MSAASPAPAATDPGPLLEVREARRRYGDRQALAGVSLTARAGEIMVLLGPNGAGKTTLLRAMGGRTVLDGGAITLGGALAGSPAVRGQVGLVPQGIALFPLLSVQANLEILGRLAGLEAARVKAAVTAALQWTGLADRAGDPVGRLSGGMQRRVNLAAGTLHAPALLLLDEPTVGLDPATRDGIHAALRRLRDQGMTLVMTTHDLEEAEALADRVALLDQGRLCALGRVRDLVDQAFGGGQEVNLRLQAGTGTAALAALADAGLTRAGPWWVGVLHSGDPGAGLKALLARVEGAGLGVAEVRVRQPGLAGVFLRLTGQAPGAAS